MSKQPPEVFGHGIPKCVISVYHPVEIVVDDTAGEYGMIGNEDIGLPVGDLSIEEPEQLKDALLSPEFEELLRACQWDASRRINPAVFMHLRSKWFIDQMFTARK